MEPFPEKSLFKFVKPKLGSVNVTFWISLIVLSMSIVGSSELTINAEQGPVSPSHCLLPEKISLVQE